MLTQTTGLAMVAAFAPRVVLACRMFPAGVSDNYVGYRDGVPVARQSFEFRREDGRFVVEARIDMRYQSARGEREYSHRSREVWKTGLLHEFDSETRLNGKVRRVRARRVLEGLEVHSLGQAPVIIAAYLVPSNLWHRDTRLVQALLDVEDGAMRSVRPTLMSAEELELGGERLHVNRYAIDGQIRRVAWYTPDCTLVRWLWPVEDGSAIIFERDPG